MLTCGDVCVKAGCHKYKCTNEVTSVAGWQCELHKQLPLCTLWFELSRALALVLTAPSIIFMPVRMYVCERPRRKELRWPFTSLCRNSCFRRRILLSENLLLTSVAEHLHKLSLPFHVRLWVYSGSSVKMMDDKLNLCLGSEGELWQSDLSWEWRVRVRRNWAPQGTRHWQIHPARRISEAFCFESWLLTSDPHPSSCHPLKDASPCQGSSRPLILVIHSSDRPRPIRLLYENRSLKYLFLHNRGRLDSRP